MIKKKHNPRILIVTPEITYLPAGMGNMANHLTAKAGGLADVSASLVAALFDHGADVHVALPNFRRMFNIEITQLINQELRVFKQRMPDSRIHLAEDRAFYYANEIYGGYSDNNPKVALAFQREVINNIVPEVQPDLIHCNDWMTGLIPAMARRMNIPCLLTVHNIHTRKLTLAEIEDRGVDAAEFWPYLFFDSMPHDYESCRSTIPVDLLASGIFAAHFINTVSPTFLHEVADGKHSFVPLNIRQEMASKLHSGCAEGILNAPDTSYNPETDKHIYSRFTAETQLKGKKENKVALQKELGLEINPDAAMLFWPSRLDPVQKGCQLLSHILYDVISRHWNIPLQLVVIANGSYQPVFRRIADFHNIRDRVAIANFSEKLSRRGYAASDFVLMPSLFEPCGLPQMIGPTYGSMPLAHDTGGLHDTVVDLSEDGTSGNGYIFKNYDPEGLRWAIDQAIEFHKKAQDFKEAAVSRIMRESASQFNHSVCAQHYIDIYENMLNRPLTNAF